MLAELRTRFIALLKERVPGFREIKEHHGRLDADEIIKHITALTPAARVGLWGRIGTEPMPDGQTVIHPGFAVAIIAKSSYLIRSHDAAKPLAEATIGVLPDLMPGRADDPRGWAVLPGVGLPENISLDISANDKLDREGIALWGVLFSVPIRLGVSIAREEAERHIELTMPDGIDLSEMQP